MSLLTRPYRISIFLYNHNRIIRTVASPWKQTYMVRSISNLPLDTEMESLQQGAEKGLPAVQEEAKEEDVVGESGGGSEDSETGSSGENDETVGVSGRGEEGERAVGESVVETAAPTDAVRASDDPTTHHPLVSQQLIACVYSACGSVCVCVCVCVCVSANVQLCIHLVFLLPSSLSPGVLVSITLSLSTISPLTAEE